MKAVTLRQLKRDMIADRLSDSLPFKLTSDGHTIAVVISVERWNQAVRQAKQDDVKLGQGSQNDVKLRQPAQPSPWYNPAIHPPGTLVRARQGRRIIEAIVPDLDGDGHVIPDIN